MRGDRSMPMNWSTCPAKARAAKSGAAAEIDGALEEGRLADRGAGGQHRLEQQRRAAIAEIVDQRGLEFRRVLIEQRPHIGRRHRRQRFGAEQHQPQAGAMAVVGIGHLRLAKRRDRRVALAELFADFAEREPGRGKAGRELDRLQQQIGGGDQIALELQIAREIEPAVGNQIAGGQEQARGHRRNRLRGLGEDRRRELERKGSRDYITECVRKTS